MKAGKAAKTEAERLVIGLTGASGVLYGIRALEACADLGIESHLVMTKPAEMTIGYETKLSTKQVAAKADYSYAVSDIAARRQTDPASLRRLVDGDLNSIAMKALEKARERRYASVYPCAMGPSTRASAPVPA